MELFDMCLGLAVALVTGDRFRIALNNGQTWIAYTSVGRERHVALTFQPGEIHGDGILMSKQCDSSAPCDSRVTKWAVADCVTDRGAEAQARPPLA